MLRTYLPAFKENSAKLWLVSGLLSFKLKRFIWAFFAWYVLSGIMSLGCVSRTPFLLEQLSQKDEFAKIELKRVPFFPQKTNQCGPAALASVLSASGVSVNPEAISPMVYLPKKEGSIQAEINATCRRYGRISYRIAPELSNLVEQLQESRPVLVLMNLGLSCFPVWHYAVVIGYDLKKDYFFLRSGDNPRELVPARVFFRTWKRADCWGIVALPPGDIPFRANVHTYLQAVADIEEKGRLKEARISYESATEKWPNEPVAFFGLGNVAYAMGDLTAAEIAFRKAYRIQPENPVIVNNLSIVLKRLGKYKESISMIDKTLVSNAISKDLRQLLLHTRDDIFKHIKTDLNDAQ